MEQTLTAKGCLSFGPIKDRLGFVVTASSQEASSLDVYKEVDGDDLLVVSHVLQPCQAETISIPANTGDNFKICTDGSCVKISAWETDVPCLCVGRTDHCKDMVDVIMPPDGVGPGEAFATFQDGPSSGTYHSWIGTFNFFTNTITPIDYMVGVFGTSSAKFNSLGARADGEPFWLRATGGGQKPFELLTLENGKIKTLATIDVYADLNVQAASAIGAFNDSTNELWFQGYDLDNGSINTMMAVNVDTFEFRRVWPGVAFPSGSGNLDLVFQGEDLLLRYGDELHQIDIETGSPTLIATLATPPTGFVYDGTLYNDDEFLYGGIYNSTTEKTRIWKYDSSTDTTTFNTDDVLGFPQDIGTEITFTDMGSVSVLPADVVKIPYKKCDNGQCYRMGDCGEAPIPYTPVGVSYPADGPLPTDEVIDEVFGNYTVPMSTGYEILVIEGTARIDDITYPIVGTHETIYGIRGEPGNQIYEEHLITQVSGKVFVHYTKW